MRNSAPIARWRNSQGVLTQSWSATGRFQARALTQEHPARIQRAKPNLFALLLALGFFIPGPLMAGAVMVALALIKERIERHMGSRRGFIAVAVTCAGFGSTLALGAPNNHWLLDGVTGALWGTAVAASSWRYSLVAGSSHENA